MGLFEVNQLGDDGRARASAAVLHLREARVAPYVDLALPGEVRTGGELDRRPRDSVWWVPERGAAVELGEDFGRWRRRVETQLDARLRPNPWRERRRERWAGVLRVGAYTVGGVLVATGVAAGAGAAVIAAGAAGARALDDVEGLEGRRASARDSVGGAVQAAAAVLGLDLDLVSGEPASPVGAPDEPAFEVRGSVLLVSASGLRELQASGAARAGLGAWVDAGRDVRLTASARRALADVKGTR